MSGDANEFGLSEGKKEVNGTVVSGRLGILDTLHFG